MSVNEETIDATLDSNGQLQLVRVPRISPGSVQVTIRAASSGIAARGLADVIREIAAEQRTRGFPGRTAEELQAEDDARLVEDAERQRELDTARRGNSPGSP